ncbi:MAG: GNAT family N-acetyltransferase [Saprospiraceae bacterium]|nr:GNAT family N-acetyltransferase [Saprospiraceae bacterium]
MKFEAIPAYKLTKKKSTQIARLLSDAFTSYPKDQTFYKQMPCFHILAWEEGNLVGHASVHHKIVYVNSEGYRIFGISDVCVARSNQKKGVGSALIDELSRIGKKGGAQFLVLITDEGKFYKKNGFKKVNSRARWVILSGNEMLGIQERKFDNSLFVKPLTDVKWPRGTIDFMGPLF